MSDTFGDRPSRWLRWAHETFGDIALHPRERTLRFVEEAIELGQAADLDSETISAIVARVYSRPPGGLRREIGQCLATLETLAAAVGVDADQEATDELARVQDIPKEEWTKRHAAKVAIGIAE